MSWWVLQKHRQVLPFHRTIPPSISVSILWYHGGHLNGLIQYQYQCHPIHCRPHPKDGEGSVFTGVCLSRFFPRCFPGVPQSWLRGGYSLIGYPKPGQDGGLPQVGVPLGRTGVPSPSQVRLGYSPPPPAGQDWGTPRDRTAERAIATRQVVCLLRSRRRTFLLISIFKNPVKTQIE